MGLEPEIGPAKLREGETNHRGTGHIQTVHRPVDDGVHNTIRCQAKQNERERAHPAMEAHGLLGSVVGSA